ncbi:MAG TPA: hypothetical protein VNT26_13825, partial [Candidatus Sulfotelmatobacter sp.]|nr:hypothetical protein [Candidatus Sulfotelmatobacter sp.]
SGAAASSSVPATIARASRSGASSFPTTNGSAAGASGASWLGARASPPNSGLSQSGGPGAHR